MFFFVLLLMGCSTKYTILTPVQYGVDTVSCIANNDPDTSGICLTEDEFKDLTKSKGTFDARSWARVVATAGVQLQLDKPSSDVIETAVKKGNVEGRKGDEAKVRTTATAKRAKLEMVHKVFASEAHNTIVEHLLRPTDNDTPKKISLSLDGLKSYYTDIWTATQVQAFEDYQDEITNVYNKARRDKSDAIETKNLAFMSSYNKLLVAYLKAYFKNGKFITVSLDPTDVESKLRQQIKERFPGIKDEEVDKILKTLKQALPKQQDGKYILYGKVGTDEFKSRGGASYAFPTVGLTIAPYGDKPFDLTKIDLLTVGTDVLRVLIEATGDAVFNLPADPSSTACSGEEKLLTPFVPNDKADFKDQAKSITTTQFNNVNAWANSSDTGVGVAAAAAIRGLGWASLNNEAVAKLIETFLSASARKSAEKVAWCAYSCTNKFSSDTSRKEDIEKYKGLIQRQIVIE